MTIIASTAQAWRGIWFVGVILSAVAAAPPVFATDDDACEAAPAEDSDTDGADKRGADAKNGHARFCLTDLGTLPGEDTSAAVAINNRGEIVGESGDGNAFLYKEGRLLPIEPLPGDDAIAVSDISDHGVVVGNSTSTSNFEAFNAAIHADGRTTALPGLKDAIPYAINEAGQIVGSAQALGPFLFSGGQAISIGTEGAVAYGINDKGHVVGLTFSSRAFLYKDGATVELGTLPGHTYSSAAAINDAGQVVGVSAPTGVNDGRAFLWTAEKGMSRLGRLRCGDTYSLATSINACGQIVGFSGSNDNFYATSGLRAFLYEGETMVDLNKLVPRRSAMTLTAAVDINDRGEIVGRGAVGDRLHAFLLTPRDPQQGCAGERPPGKHDDDDAEAAPGKRRRH